MHKQNKRALRTQGASAAKKTPKVAAKKTARKVVKVAKRKMKTNVAGVTFADQKKPIATMAAPLAPFSDLETIRSAVDQYQSSFALKDHESPMQGLGKIIKKHGVLPFAFLGLAALASKEVFAIDPGVLITFNTSTVIFSYYIVGYEGAKKSYTEFLDTINGKYQEGLKASVEILEAGIKHCQSALDKPGIIQDANAAFQEAHDAVTVARVNAAKQKHKDGILSKLNAIASSEALEAKQQADAVRDHAMQYLQANAFSDKVKADVLEEAIAMVGKKTGTDAQEFKALQTVLKNSLESAQKAKK